MQENTETPTPTTPADAFGPLLDALIAAAPEENKGAAEMQIILRPGAAFAGATRKTQWPGLYVTTSIGNQAGKGESPRPIPVELYFLSRDVLRVDLMKEPSRVQVVSNNGAVIPGLRG